MTAADVLKLLQEAEEAVYLAQLHRCRELRRKMQELTPQGGEVERDYRVQFI